MLDFMFSAINKNTYDLVMGTSTNCTALISLLSFKLISDSVLSQLTMQNSSENKDFRKRDSVAAAAELATAVTCTLWAPWDFSELPSILNFADTSELVRHHCKVWLLNSCIHWRELNMPSHHYYSKWNFPVGKGFSVFAVGAQCFLLFLKID